MKIVHIRQEKLTERIPIADSFAGDGYRQGPGGQLPDVDIDFQSDRRQEVKEYLERRYNTDGRQQVFSAGTLTTLKMKAVLKDVSRVHRVPVGAVNYITAIFGDDNMTWTDLFKLAATNKKVRDFILRYPKVIEDIRPLMGQPRSGSVHASAIIITPKQQDGEPMECFDYTPIKKVDDLLISELDGYSIDEVGLLKNDCLGIKELSKIQAVIDICNREYGAGLSFEGIVRSGLDDEKTYRLLSEGYTQNVFQFSSTGMTRFLQDMRPQCIGDLIAAGALYRPATLDSGSAEKYLLCRREEVAPVYLWGTYDALKNTHGVLVFQEQLAQMAREVGGFSLAEGVRLLKLISKKKIDVIRAMKEKFMTGASAKGCPKEDAEHIWEMIEAGGGYLFNASHATAYAVTSYVGAYLKANYPTAFYTVALQWADDKEIPLLMSEMELCSKARIVPPEINTSRQVFFTDYGTDEIFWSLGRIKQMGAKARCLHRRGAREKRSLQLHRALHPPDIPVQAQKIRLLGRSRQRRRSRAGAGQCPTCAEHDSGRMLRQSGQYRYGGGTLRAACPCCGRAGLHAFRERLPRGAGRAALLLEPPADCRVGHRLGGLSPHFRGLRSPCARERQSLLPEPARRARPGQRRTTCCCMRHRHGVVRTHVQRPGDRRTKAVRQADAPAEQRRGGDGLLERDLRSPSGENLRPERPYRHRVGDG